MPTNDSRSLTRITKTATVHKVIDITREPQSTTQQHPLPQILASAACHRVALLAAGGLVLAALILVLALPHGAGKSAAAATTASAPAPKAAPVVIVPTTPAAAAKAAPVFARAAAPLRPILIELSLPTAVQQGLVQCQWRGNGKNRLFMDAHSSSDQPLRMHLAAGQLLASEDSTIVVMKSQTLDFQPHAIRHEVFPIVATSSANKVVGAEYHLSAGTLPDLDKLFAYVTTHPEASPSAVQTATLILTENLPLSSFAKFNQLSAGAANLHENQDFKADTVDILSALTLVRNIGIDRPLAVTIDPQLEVEAMIDPDAHAVAIEYYHITDEWAYWKNQLLAGDPSTRHYALYGIARSYPDVALEMLPKWARGESVSSVFRLSAIQALAQTNRPAAIPILRELEREFGGSSDLGHAAHVAANFLDAQFAPPVSQGHHQTALASAGN